MKITSVEAIQLNIPLKEPFVIALGKCDIAENVLIKIHLEDGTVGYGEVSSSGVITGDIQSTIIDVVKYLTPALIGEDIENYRRLIKKLRSIVKFHPGVFAGIESALLDAYTQYIGIPLYQFLGGAKDEIDHAGYRDDQKVVVDKNIITSQGPATAICFALHIVKKYAGNEMYEQLRNGLLVDFC